MLSGASRDERHGAVTESRREQRLGGPYAISTGHLPGRSLRSIEPPRSDSMTEHGVLITSDFPELVSADARNVSACPVAGCAISADVSGSDLTGCCHKVYIQCLGKCAELGRLSHMERKFHCACHSACKAYRPRLTP